MYQLTTETEHRIITAGAAKIDEMRGLCRSHGRNFGLTKDAAVNRGIKDLFGTPQQFRFAIVAKVAHELDLGEAEVLYALTSRHLL